MKYFSPYESTLQQLKSARMLRRKHKEQVTKAQKRFVAAMKASSSTASQLERNLAELEWFRAQHASVQSKAAVKVLENEWEILRRENFLEIKKNKDDRTVKYKLLSFIQSPLDFLKSKFDKSYQIFVENRSKKW